MSRLAKLQTLAEIEGFESSEELLEAFVTDSVCPGICINSGCEYTTEVEPDCAGGYCEVCGTQSVRSAMILAGVI